jgi:phenylpyruvate tautomerase PptA (4-oxalocrotonate tautomerase family)
MPLVRIDVVEGRRDPEQLRLLADTVQEIRLDVLAAPPRDRYQVITEHRPGQQGRSVKQERALYAGLCRRLGEVTGLTAGDLVVSVLGNAREDWSFGLRRAQFLDSDL